MYQSYELETLAVFESLKHFRVYLVGIHFRMVTGCTAVREVLAKRELVPAIARWWLAFQDNDMEIEYRVGAHMHHIDALSRNPVRRENAAGMAEAVGVCLVSLLGGN